MTVCAVFQLVVEKDRRAGIDGKVGISSGSQDQDGQRADRLIFKTDGVGRRRSLGDGDGSAGEKQTWLVVIHFGNGNAFNDAAIAAVHGGVGNGAAARSDVVIVCRGDGHGLRRVPSDGGEGQSWGSGG